MPCSNFLFQIHDAGSCNLRPQAEEASRIQESKHRCDVLLVGLKRLRVGFLAVIGLIRQSQTRLNNVGHRLLGAGVLFYPEGNRGADALALQHAQVVRQLFRVRRHQLVQIFGQRRRSRSVHSLNVHVGGIHDPRTAFVFLNDVMDEFLGFVAKRVKSPVNTAVIGNNVGLNPGAINKLIQILHALHSMSDVPVSVVCMTSYRFPPAKMTGPFFAVLGVTLLVLGTPAVLSLALPDHDPETEPVVLDDPEWRQPIDGVECSVNYDSVANQAWDCGDTLVEAYLTSDVDDDELALRRAVRATTCLLYTSPSPRDS